MALSLTEATPSMISPSEGMMIAGLDQHHVAGAQFERADGLDTALEMVAAVGSISRLAMVSPRVARRVAACALPRPSAMASAKVANSTVNHSHTAIWPEKNGDRRRRGRDRAATGRSPARRRLR